MTFTEALKTGLPMRRLAWTHLGPMTDVEAAVHQSSWVYPRTFVANPAETIWIWLSTGLHAEITRADMIAADWEVMPYRCDEEQ